MGTYFDSYCSALNPLNANSAHGLYVYGTLPLFMAKAAGDVMVQGSEFVAHNILGNPDYSGDQWVSYDGIHLVWRFLSALAEMSIIVICFLIGVKLHDKWVGLLAAFLYATAVFSIQMAHFGTADSISNLFAALTILFAVVVQREGKLLNYALFGVFFGCAVASRINLAPLAGLIALAALIQVLPVFDDRVAPDERNRALILHGGGLVLAAFLSLLCFRVFNPYAFQGPGFFGLSLDPRWLDNMQTAQVLIGGSGDSPPNFQWVARTPYLYPLQNMVLWGMGVPFGIVAWISWAWAGCAAAARQAARAAKRAAGGLGAGLFRLAGAQLGHDHALLPADLSGAGGAGGVGADLAAGATPASTCGGGGSPSRWWRSWCCSRCCGRGCSPTSIAIC